MPDKLTVILPLTLVSTVATMPLGNVKPVPNGWPLTRSWSLASALVSVTVPPVNVLGPDVMTTSVSTTGTAAPFSVKVVA